MLKSISFLSAVLFLSFTVQAAITISPTDIQQDAEGYYYLYELTFNDLSTSSTKFEDDVSTVSNITVHKTLPAVPPYEPDPRWVYAKTGQSTASLTFVFDFSGVQFGGFDLNILSVDLHDKLVMQNNSNYSEDSQAVTSWSTNGTLWNTFNSASTPTRTRLPITTVQTNTLIFSSNPNTFYYRVLFDNADADGFGENLNMWNYLTNSQTNHFYVQIRLTYDTLLEGEGTEANPYLISTPEDLIYLGDHTGLYDKHFLMTNDIDMDGYGPFETALIAPDTDNSIGFQGTSFAGHFNGNGYVVRNLTCTTTEVIEYIGLFGFVRDSEIRSLGVENVSIQVVGNLVGGLAGYNDGGIITDCYVTGTVIGTGYVGGLVGYNSGGPITDSYATSTVIGTGYVGGLVGCNYGPITDCYATGTVSGNDYVGGLAGYNHGIIEASTASGIVNGSTFIGGLVGTNSDESDILNCYCSSVINAYSDYCYVGGFIGYNAGAVANSYSTRSRILKFPTSPYGTFVGAFVGKDDSLESTDSTASYTACFWDTEATGMTDAVGQSDDDTHTTPDPTYPDPDPAGITGLPTATLKVQGLYTSFGWDFLDETANGTEDIWGIVENVTYPRFAWECIDPPAGDVNGDCVINLLDFAQMSEDWLKCGLMDGNLCP